MKKVWLYILLSIPYSYCYSQACNTPLRIVVLGSSTAWGNGLPSRDSAWTFRYAHYLKMNHNQADTLINLAVGGYTTQQIMPDGTAPYVISGNTFNVEVQHNITKALSLNPDAIIINMPSNDEAQGFPLAKQTANFLALKQVAAKAKIPMWVTTTQPRSNLGLEAAVRLRQMKDTIIKYFADKSINFYDGLATPSGFIDPIYNSGDNIHFNSAGQRILFERVIAKSIPDILCINNNIAANSNADDTTSGFTLFPNPASDYVYFRGIRENVLSIQVYNALGELVYRQQKTMNKFLNISKWKPGTYFVIVNHTRRKFVKVEK